MPRTPEIRPFRPRTYSDRPIDLTLAKSIRDRLHFDEPRHPITFIDETQAQIDADLEGLNGAIVLGVIAGLIAAALIWWVQS